MTLAVRSSTATVALVTLAFGALLVTAAGCNLMIPSAPTTATGILITQVPTVEHGSSLVSTPTTTMISQDVQTDHDTSAGVPLSESDQSPVSLMIPEPLFDSDLDLIEAPVDVPLEIQIPALDLNAPVIGVGLTLTNEMASPVGRTPEDPMWQTIFWYRGSGIPGAVGTATFAGHFTDWLGQPAVFAYLDELQIGDLIIVQDERNGLDIPFAVTEKTYTDQEIDDPAVLARIFGSQAVSSAETQPMSDQFSRLTLITCGGAWVDGSFERRLVVYAIRVSYPA